MHIAAGVALESPPVCLSNRHSARMCAELLATQLDRNRECMQGMNAVLVHESEYVPVLSTQYSYIRCQHVCSKWLTGLSVQL